jgi:hypothetical protein
MILTSADKIFDKTSFQEDIDYLEFPKISFTCEAGNEILFSMKHFKKQATSKVTNLNFDDATAIDAFVNEQDIDSSNSFLDFYCPGTGDAVRIYYNAWAGGRFTAGYDIKYIVRKPKENEID